MPVDKADISSHATDPTLPTVTYLVGPVYFLALWEHDSAHCSSILCTVTSGCLLVIGQFGVFTPWKSVDTVHLGFYLI